jgi:hypothetical protein
VVRNERYDAGEREAWRRMLERDRRHLRRQMLEEAAGIAGLHARRKDAEQKLRMLRRRPPKLVPAALWPSSSELEAGGDGASPLRRLRRRQRRHRGGGGGWGWPGASRTRTRGADW